MAAKTTAKKRAVAKADAKYGTVGKVRLLYPVLASCTLNRNDPPEDARNEEVKRFYESTIRAVELSKNPNVAVCEFSAGQTLKDTTILEIQATYFVAFSHEDTSLPDTDKCKLLEEMAEAAAWPLFRDLFIHIGSQSGEELPLLPNVPKLRWLKPHEDADETTPRT